MLPLNYPVVDARNGSALVLVAAYADRRRPGPNGAFLKAVVALRAPYSLPIRCRFFFPDAQPREVEAEKKLEYHCRELAPYVRY